MEILFTKDPHWILKWDKYVTTEDRASHLMLSDWNKSFESYGFEFEICIVLQNDTIIGGFTAVLAKAFFLKFYIVPFGPIVSQGFEVDLNQIIKSVYSRAVSKKCFYAQINIPFSDKLHPHLMPNTINSPFLESASRGHLFKYVYSSNGLNWKSFETIENENQLLESVKTSLRRDIRSSIRKGLVSKELITYAEIKNGYDLCLKNAKQNNYNLRDWNSFKQTIVSLIDKKSAKFIAAYKDDELKGALFLVKSGNYYTYIFGGTKKEKPDLLVGHFLQFEAMQAVINEKLSGYNISLGGSKGVVQLKNNYADDQLIFENSKYHWVINSFYFKVFLYFEKRLNVHKKFLSKFLSIIKRK